MTNEKQQPGPVDADELFMKLSVPELNVYERRTRQDIENKKQELRMMVGERYRDLIGAADCIVRMKETALMIQDNISKMRHSCDIHALKRNVAAKTTKARSGSMDDMQKSLYTSAAQIKLLADVPEQIWRNIESNSYLTASRLYLISKAIYKNLNAGLEDDEHQSVRVMETFPVVGRQWDAVSHFKAQILQKSHHHLKAAKETDQVVVDTLCAIMLLDDVTIKDMFKLFLAQRQTAIREILDSQSEDIGAQIVQAIGVLQATLFHVAGVFLESESGHVSVLQRHLKTSPHNHSASVITKLYPTTPNIHLLVRYLPESIQNFTPFIRLDGQRASFSQQDVLQGVRHWMEDVKTMFSNGFERLLKQVQTSSDLVVIRAQVWAVLQADEYALETRSHKNPWNDVCSTLLGDTFSIWNQILRSGYTKAFQDVIVSSLGELLQQPTKLLRPRLGDLDHPEDPNHDIGRFLWHDNAIARGGAGASASLPSATEPLIQKIREYVAGKTELVAQVTSAFEETLLAIRSDQEKALVFNKESVFGTLLEDGEGGDGGEDEDDRLYHHEKLDLFGAKADTRDLVEFYQRHCVDIVKAYSLRLEELVQEAVRKPDKTRNTIPAMDRAMTVGRVASGLASMGWTLQRTLVPPKDSAQASNFAQARAAKTKIESHVQELVAAFRNVYLLSHGAWIESVEWTLTRSVKRYLHESSWTDVADLAWEPITSATTNANTNTSTPPSSNRSLRGSPANSSSSTPAPPSSSSFSMKATASEESKTLLPFHVSTRLVSALYQVVQEMHRVGTGFMSPELIQVLTAKAARIVLESVDQFLTEIAPCSNGASPEGGSPPPPLVGVVTEKGALQLLFDLKFLKWVFQSSIDKDTALTQLMRSVTGRIKDHIDPINLAVFEKPLEVNAERQYGRVAVLLGLLVQLNPVESKRKVNVVEKSPHVFAMAPLTARFTLLPIGQKMTGRVV
ncbi:Golgi transport complex subunit 1 [Mortierella alpina]|uniref:Conserved oligomeric Golgi complex subunit 1 n=1 Tax=Mortierella alpina TaxID=64518 RepID=A0A9P6JAS3_MORAP|nr:Golgi transport complex subunit 1 [Mortierella alpina]